MKKAALARVLSDPTVAGAYWLSTRDAVLLRAAASLCGYACVAIDLEGCGGKAGLLVRLAEALKFPAHFGHNWDALADSLGDLRQSEAPGLVLFLEHGEDLRRNAPHEFERAVAVLRATSREWAESATPLWVFVAVSPAEFEQQDRARAVAGVRLKPIVVEGAERG